MFEEPKICMSPEQLPRQHLRLVVDLPPRPQGFVVRVIFENDCFYFPADFI